MEILLRVIIYIYIQEQTYMYYFHEMWVTMIYSSSQDDYTL